MFHFKARLALSDRQNWACGSAAKPQLMFAAAHVLARSGARVASFAQQALILVLGKAVFEELGVKEMLGGATAMVTLEADKQARANIKLGAHCPFTVYLARFARDPAVKLLVVSASASFRFAQEIAVSWPRSTLGTFSALVFPQMGPPKLVALCAIFDE